jgi:hypothetical protein
MTICTSDPIRFPGVKGRKIEALFNGQVITSDGAPCCFVWQTPPLQAAVGRDMEEEFFLCSRIRDCCDRKYRQTCHKNKTSDFDFLLSKFTLA